jgi:hypothetical protein
MMYFPGSIEMQLSNQPASHPKHKHKNDHRPPGFADGGGNQGLLPANRTSRSKRLWKVNNVELLSIKLILQPRTGVFSQAGLLIVTPKQVSSQVSNSAQCNLKLLAGLPVCTDAAFIASWTR